MSTPELIVTNAILGGILGALISIMAQAFKCARHLQEIERKLKE